MKNLNPIKTYCDNCGDFVEIELQNEEIIEIFKGKQIHYHVKVRRCKRCSNEIGDKLNYNIEKTKAKIEAYNKLSDNEQLENIEKLFRKYNINDEELADILADIDIPCKES